MTDLRRGFKAQADRVAEELRSELQLGPYDRLSPFALAEHLGIGVASLASLAASGASRESIAHFHHAEPGVFSATTVLDGTRALIIYNCRHAPTRTANSIAHELSHIVLEHEAQSIVSLGCRHWNAPQEAEATWLGGCLLVPAEAALAVARSDTPLEDAAAHFGISPVLMRMRLNLSGALARVKRERARGRDR